MTHPYGTPVIFGRAFGYVVAPRRMYGQDGYDVIEAEPNGDPGALAEKHWIPATGVASAVVNQNVCGQPFPLCTCPMVHVRRRTLEALHARLERLERTAAAPVEAGGSA